MQPTFLEALQHIQELAKTKEKVTIREIRSLLAKRGIAALLIIFSIPIPIPGISNLFGLILALVAFQNVFRNELWWPKWVLKRTITSAHLQQFTGKMIPFVESVQRYIHPRYSFLVQNRPFRQINAFVICILAFIIALPLPIPFTNILFAVPLLALAFALLEDDGLFVMLGYFVLACEWLIFFVIYRSWNHLATL